jgi:hypothetical protein
MLFSRTCIVTKNRHAAKFLQLSGKNFEKIRAFIYFFKNHGDFSSKSAEIKYYSAIFEQILKNQ